MKKKLLIIIPIILIIICLGGIVWWKMPVRFLKNISPETIASIEVRDGNNGKYFVITDSNDISYIVNNIQEKSLQKRKISLGYTGTTFHLQFFDIHGKKIDSFFINYYNTIRKDPFFYSDSTDGLCMDYLRNLEEQLAE